MKKYFKYFLFLSFFSSMIKGQDTIIKKDNFIIVGKIVEVGSLIKYTRVDNPSGPTYSIERSKIKLIHYSNGLVENYNEPEERSSYSEDPQMLEKLLTIYTNIPKNMLSELNLGFEWGVNKWLAIGVGGGMIYASSILDPLPLSPSQDQWPGTVYEGGVARLNFKVYTSGRTSDYFNFQFLYKMVSFNDNEFTDKVYDGNHYDNFVTYKRSETTNVSGFAIMHGHEYASANGHLYFDFFYGFGIRYRERKINTTESRTIYHASDGSYPAVGYSERFQTFPVIETGFKMGFNILKKNKKH